MLVYDNGFDQAIGGGNIKIHNGNGNAAPSARPNALSVQGTLVKDPGQIGVAKTLADMGLQVTVKNLSTAVTLSTFASQTDTNGTFRLSFDLTQSQPVKVGDILQVTAQSPTPFISVEPLHYTVTTDDILAGQILLPDLVVYEIPQTTELLANYPNPFNPETWIAYRLAKAANVTLTIYAMSGEAVRTISVGHQRAAVYESKQKSIYWDGRSNTGERVASGVYFYQLKAGDFFATRKMTILK